MNTNENLIQTSTESTADSGLARQIMSDIIVHMKYARHLKELKRRESWSEAVDRNKQMHIKKFPHLAGEIEEAYKYVYSRKVLPSMRSMQFGGRPIEVNNARMFNCSFCAVDHPDVFSEAMFLLLSGVGFGYSVQRRHIEKLPAITKPTKTRRFLIGDSIEGWSDAIKVLLSAYFKGKPLPKFDYSDIRPKGALLVTSGGKAPGPEPLKTCLDKIGKLLSQKNNGDQLEPHEAHDIMCYIADAVLSGGIRRAAMISLFDFDNEVMTKIKGRFPVKDYTVVETLPWGGYELMVYVDEPGYGVTEHRIVLSKADFDSMNKSMTLPWYFFRPERGRANNSAVILRHKITKEEFLEFWEKVKESGSGEPGFMFSNDADWGLNPCAEVSLHSAEFCNLTTINVSDVDSQEELEARAKSASFIGTLQASYTDFHYLRDIWKKTTEKGALIGVSMTGIATGGVLKLDLEKAAEVVKQENERVAKLIGINKADRCTVVKPEGTTSLVLGSSSGIHAWHNDYYLRRVGVKKNESIYKYLAAMHPELLEDDFFRPDTDAFIVIPMAAPNGAITRHESAMDLLSRIKKVSETWIKGGHRKGNNTNNVSATVTIKDHEWEEVGEWMWENRESYTALSILPYDGHTYRQTPFEDCTKEEYERRLSTLTEVDLSLVVEDNDDTNLSNELACMAGGCEVS